MIEQANDTDTAIGGSTSSTQSQGTVSQGTAAQVREKVEQALGATRDKTSEALGAVREKASLAAHRTAEEIDQYPVAALVGGLALGAIAGVLLPATRQEAKVLGPLGTRVGDAARVAADAAREAGKTKLGELGISSDAARDQVTKLVDNALKVAGEVGTAAAQAARPSGAQS
jgi:ElaB/YqjD/DUF883 family membrane-anchored ribosome-binding protein